MLHKALITLYKVTRICAVTTLSIVHPSLDVHTGSILIHIISLINPLLIKKKQLIQGGIEVYASNGDSTTRNGDSTIGNGHCR